MPSRFSKPPRNESVLKDRIVCYLRANGIMCWRAGAGPYAPAGIPDIIGVLRDGRMLAIEAKMPGRKVTLMQAVMLDGLRLNNALVIVAYSLDDVEACLKLPLTKRVYS